VNFPLSARRLRPAPGGYQDLAANRLGVAVDPAAGEQWLKETALAQVLIVLAGHQAIAEGMPKFTVEAVVLAEVGHLCGEHLLSPFWRADQVELRPQPPEAPP